MNNFPEAHRHTKDTKTDGVEGDEQRRIVAFARPPSPWGRRGPANPNLRPFLLPPAYPDLGSAAYRLLDSYAESRGEALWG